MTQRLVYRIPEVCKILGISRATFHRRVKTGEIAIHKFGGMTFVKGEGFKRLLETINGPTPDQPPDLAGDTARQGATGSVGLLQPGVTKVLRG